MCKRHADSGPRPFSVRLADGCSRTWRRLSRKPGRHPDTIAYPWRNGCHCALLRRIIALAENISDTNEPFRRLLNFAQIQRVYCLWGLMPGSVGDEESPFNECSHAYLAAAKAILLQMRALKGEKAEIDDLVSDIDAMLIRNNLSLILCKFSGESFNTADLIRPELADIVLHAKSLAAILSAALVILAGLWLAARSSRPESQSLERFSYSRNL